MIQNDIADISLAALQIRQDRLEFMEFTVYTWKLEAVIMFRHPKTGLRNVFLEPLDVFVWLLTFSVIIFSSSLIFFSMKFQKSDEKKIFSPTRAWILSVAILCQQGFIENFSKFSTRIILFSTIMFTMIVYQFYSSFIVGSLLTAPPKTINTLRDLINSDLEVGVEDVTYNNEFFEKLATGDALELYRKKIEKKNNYYKVTDGIRQMQKGGFAFQIDCAYAYTSIKQQFTDEEMAELHTVVLFPSRQLFPTVAKQSPIKEFITVGLMRLWETGIISYQLSKWRAPKPKQQSSITTVKAVDIEQMSTVFMFLFVAMVFSFLILFGEIIYYKMVFKKQVKKFRSVLNFKRNVKTVESRTPRLLGRRTFVKHGKGRRLVIIQNIFSNEGAD